MVPGEQLQVDADELSSGNEAHANFFGVFPFKNIMATPVSEHRFPNSPTIGEMLRVQEVIIERLRKKLCQIEVLKQRVLQGCELDAAQREKLGREDELFTALEEALDVAEAAVAVPQTGPGSPQKSEVQSALDEPRPQQPRVVVTQTRPSGPQEHKERSALVQRPQQSCATAAARRLDANRAVRAATRGSLCSEAPPMGGSCALGHHPSLRSTALFTDRRKLPPAWGVRAGERG